jgi:hypothetical protein
MRVLNIKHVWLPVNDNGKLVFQRLGSVIIQK